MRPRIRTNTLTGYAGLARSSGLDPAALMAEVGLSEGIHALRNSKVGHKKELMLNGTALTAERLRGIINIHEVTGLIAGREVAVGIGFLLAKLRTLVLQVAGVGRSRNPRRA